MMNQPTNKVEWHPVDCQDPTEPNSCIQLYSLIETSQLNTPVCSFWDSWVIPWEIQKLREKNLAMFKEVNWKLMGSILHLP